MLFVEFKNAYGTDDKRVSINVDHIVSYTSIIRSRGNTVINDVNTVGGDDLGWQVVESYDEVKKIINDARLASCGI